MMKQGNSNSTTAAAAAGGDNGILPDGFRILLNKAIRIDDDNDWSVHTVDYGQFKQKLKFFARRRSALRNLLRNSSDGLLSEEELEDLLGPKTPFPVAVGAATNATITTTAATTSSSVTLPALTTMTGTSPPARSPFMFLHSPNNNNTSAAAESSPHQDSTHCYIPFMETEPTPSFDAAASIGSASSTGFGGGIRKQQQHYRRRNKRSILRRVSTAERNEMMLFLTLELEKAQMFYISAWQKLSHQIDSQETTTTIHSNNNNNNSISPELGDEILELMAFCVINIIVAKQMLIRYDAFALEMEGTPLMNYFMKHVQTTTAFRKLLYHEELQAIADQYVARWPNYDDDHQHHFIDNINNHMTGATSPVIANFMSQRFMFQDILKASLQQQHQQQQQGDNDARAATPTNLIQISSSSGSNQLQQQQQQHAHADTIMMNQQQHTFTKKQWSWESITSTFRRWLLLGLFEDRLDFEAAYLNARGQSLVPEMQQLAEWRKKKHEILPRAEEGPKRLSGMQVYHLVLNLLSAFLYCMNYYIVEPSSTMYVNRLGAHDAMSGTLIGMMPLAAFVSSIPYSMWTNRSFRHPFIMSCFMLITGNLVYSLADRFGKVSIALAGRFICGLGAPKCIIRRYMADTTPVSLRTSVNAGFGMVVAAGSAMGPAMAIVLTQIETNIWMPYGIGYIHMNGLTLPGYFMACLWITFSVVVLATFHEPDREGLAEQKKLEELGGIPGSPSFKGVGLSEDYQQYHDRELVEMRLEERPSMSSPPPLTAVNPSKPNDLRMVFSMDSSYHRYEDGTQSVNSQLLSENDKYYNGNCCCCYYQWPLIGQIKSALSLITLPVRLCLGLLFAKVFTIEALVSATSALSKNRYHWQVRQVGLLGFTNGLLVIPFSIMIGRLSLSYQDHILMRYLVAAGCFGMFLLIDISDLVDTPTGDYNKKHPLAVSPRRYIAGYFISYLSIQAFEGVIGSTLSKVIPTALASGTVNSGLLATLVDTFGRACGDMFISLCGFIDLRQLMNLLFIPGFAIMLTCLVVIERHRDMLSV